MEREDAGSNPAASFGWRSSAARAPNDRRADLTSGTHNLEPAASRCERRKPMTKFNTPKTRAAGGSSPVVTDPVATGRTFEGGPGYARDAKSELFLLAVTNMVGERTFYEAAGARDHRYEQLVRQVAVADPVWTAGFLAWLRGDANMRSAALVGAAEFVRGRLTAGNEQTLPRQAHTTEGTDSLSYSTASNRRVIDSVLQRADEPGELLAYWTSRYGRAIPKPVKRGVADAVLRLYNQRSLLKYDTPSHGFRFGDVLDLVHPATSLDEQGVLFKYALDRRHGRAVDVPDELGMLGVHADLMAWPVEKRRELFTRRADSAPVVLREAGMSWEAVAGWLQGPLDAAVWEALIPSMGYMALLRNLRNFDEAGVTDETASAVAARLADPEQVAKSRQLPMRFLSAHRAAPSLRWGYALEQALGRSVTNIPELGGRTLILVDTSGSMDSGFSKDGVLRRWDAAATFGIALGQRCATAEVVSYSSAGYWGGRQYEASKVFPTVRGESVLRSLDRWKNGGYFINGGTDTAGAVARHYRQHDRVVVITDEQARGYDHVFTAVPAAVPTYTWDMAGYKFGHAPGGTNRHTFGGLTDQAFKMIPLLEAGRNAAWPWM
jgi:hypothetical protein